MSSKIIYIKTEDGIKVWLDGVPIEIPINGIQYSLVMQAIQDNASEEDIKEALEVKHAIESKTEGRITFENGQLSANGCDIAPSVGRRLTDLITNGITDITPWLKFVDNLIDNPSKASTDELYDWLEHQGLPLADDGCVLGYKGVRDDYYSYTGNTNTLVLNGIVNESGNILNAINSTVEVARNTVDDNREHGCAEGLHIGNYEYADGFSGDGKLLLVKFNPRDAVSVPNCSSFQKLRVCKYEVVKDLTPDRGFLTEPLYSIEDGQLHAQTTSSQDKILSWVAGELEEWNKCEFLETARQWDIKPDSLIKILHKHGYRVNYHNTAIPTIEVNQQSCNDPYDN